MNSIPSVSPLVNSIYSNHVGKYSPTTRLDFNSVLSDEVKVSTFLLHKTKEMAQNNVTPYRSDTDSVLVQLMASQKILSPRVDEECNIHPRIINSLAEFDLFCCISEERSRVNNSTNHGDIVSALISDLSNCDLGLDANYDCNIFLTNPLALYLQQFSSQTPASLAYSYVWAPFETIRFPSVNYKSQPPYYRRMYNIKTLTRPNL